MRIIHRLRSPKRDVASEILVIPYLQKGIVGLGRVVFNKTSIQILLSRFVVPHLRIERVDVGRLVVVEKRTIHMLRGQRRVPLVASDLLVARGRFRTLKSLAGRRRVSWSVCMDRRTTRGAQTKWILHVRWLVLDGGLRGSRAAG